MISLHGWSPFSLTSTPIAFIGLSPLPSPVTTANSSAWHSSSILLVYDGAATEGPTPRNPSELVCSVDARIVDFAHAHRLSCDDPRFIASTLDEVCKVWPKARALCSHFQDYLFGLRNLLAQLDVIAQPGNGIVPLLTTPCFSMPSFSDLGCSALSTVLPTSAGPPARLSNGSLSLSSLLHFSPSSPDLSRCNQLPEA